MKPTNAGQELATQPVLKLNELQKNLAEFKGTIVTSLNITKWIVSVAAMVVVALIGIGGWQLFAAIGRLENRVIDSNSRIEVLEERVLHLDRQVNEVNRLIEKRLPPADK
jgi:hypothetical protein